MTTPEPGAPIELPAAIWVIAAAEGHHAHLEEQSARAIADPDDAVGCFVPKAELDALRKRHDLCGGCDGLNCAHLWPSQRKCCPDCTHDGPEAATAAEGEMEPWCERCGHYETDHPRGGRCGAATEDGCDCPGFKPTEPQPPAGSKDSSPSPGAPDADADSGAAKHRVAAPTLSLAPDSPGDGAGDPGGGEERVTVEAAFAAIGALSLGTDKRLECLDALRKAVLQQEQSEREAAELQERVDDLKEQRKEARSERDAALDTNNSLRAEVAELKAERDGLREQLQTLRDLVQAHGKVVRSLLLRECQVERQAGLLGKQLVMTSALALWQRLMDMERAQQSPTSAKVEPPLGGFTIGARIRKRYETDKHGQFAKVTGFRPDGCVEFIDDIGRTGFDEPNDLELADYAPAASPGRDRPVMVGELVSALHWIHQSSRSERIETRLGGLLFKLLADELESKAGK